MDYPLGFLNICTKLKEETSEKFLNHWNGDKTEMELQKFYDGFDKTLSLMSSIACDNIILESVPSVSILEDSLKQKSLHDVQSKVDETLEILGRKKLIDNDADITYLNGVGKRFTLMSRRRFFENTVKSAMTETNAFYAQYLAFTQKTLWSYFERVDGALPKVHEEEEVEYKDL